MILTRATEMTKGPFEKHIETMTNDYGVIHVVDLLQDLREREIRLTKEYYKLYLESPWKESGQLRFLHFDFHRFCKGDQFSELKVLMTQLSDSIDEFGWLTVDLKNEEIVSRQKGVFRVNCLDSIDRTNVAISQLSMTLFQTLLEQNEFKIDHLLGDNV